MPITSGGSKFVTEAIRVSATSGGASGNVLYTCPANFSAHVHFLLVSAGIQANKKITIQFYHEEDATYHYLVNGLDMAANAIRHIVEGNFITLHPGDKIVCYTDTANNFDVTVSVEEFFDGTRY